MRRLLSLLTTPVFVVVSLVSTPRADSPVDRLQAFYSSFKDLEGTFTQRNRVKELNKTVSYKGHFYLKQNRLFIDYKGQNPQKVYITGSEIVIYNEGQKTAYRIPFDERRYGQTPVALLRGFADLKAEFDIKIIDDKRLILRPLKGEANIEKIDLSLTEGQDFPISSFVLTDKLGNTTEIVFGRYKLNQGISDSLFRFSPPQGTTVVEQ